MIADDLQRMRDQLFFEGPERDRRVSRYWLLLLLAAVIATSGVIADSTATVIGAMIVAPLMTPILGIVLAIVLSDAANLRRSILYVLAGGFAVIAIAWGMGHLLPFPVVAETNSQVSARVSPTLIDLVAALATGAVGAIALARSDISDTLPGVAIAISLVPPLSVVGLTLESGAPRQALGSFVLFLTNVSAILASGIVVMLIYRVPRFSDALSGRTGRRRGAVAIVAGLVVIVAIPLAANSVRVDQTVRRETQVRVVAERWAHRAGWSVQSVTTTKQGTFVQATGPAPPPNLPDLRKALDDDGLGKVKVRVNLVTGDFADVP